MHRRRAAADRNQPEIVAALRKAGCTVQHIHVIGMGCPDILVGFRGNNFLMEIKDGMASNYAKRLTEDEKHWHALWRGNVNIVESVEQALKVVGAI